MARERLQMRKVEKFLACHFDEGRSMRTIATRCGLSRRSVSRTLERFAASGLSWQKARDLDEPTLEGELYGRSRDPERLDVDRAAVDGVIGPRRDAGLLSGGRASRRGASRLTSNPVASTGTNRQPRL